MSSIEWTDETWNPVRGCDKVSQGCKHCYAETFAERFRGTPGHPYEQGFDLRLVPEKLCDPLRWSKPRLVFVNSMSDLFHKDVPFEFIAAVIGTAALTPRHTYQILTKRPERMAEFFAWVERESDGSSAGMAEFCVLALNDALRRSDPKSKMWALADRAMDVWSWASQGPYGFEAMDDGDVKDIEKRIASAKRSGADEIDAEAWPLPNVWLGTSAEDQDNYDKRVPALLSCPAALHFVSLEPLLGAIDMFCTPVPLGMEGEGADYYNPLGGYGYFRDGEPASTGERIDWVIVGGESGPGARDCEVSWIRSVVGQCKAAGVPVFVKQLGARPVETTPVTSSFASNLCGEMGAMTMTANRRKALATKSRKGSDPSEWPSDLRVQEMPRIGGGS